MAPIPGITTKTSYPQFVGAQAANTKPSEIATAGRAGTEVVDSFESSSSSALSGNWNDIIQQNKLRQMANGRASGQIVLGGPGDLWDARANLQEIHEMANNAVDKKGPLSPAALILRGTEVLYQMSPAPTAQEAGEAWGDPASSKGQKAWTTANLGLHLLEVAPAARLIAKGAQGLKAATVTSRSARVGGNSLGLAGSFRARQSAAGFARVPGKADTVAAAAGSVREASSSVQQVANMKEFFESTKLGKALSGRAEKTSRIFQGASVYKTNGKVKVGETVLKQGDHFYLDNMHKDHIEVFSKNGVVKDVLDFCGNRLLEKLQKAKNQGRSIKDLVSDGNSVHNSNFLA